MTSCGLQCLDRRLDERYVPFTEDQESRDLDFVEPFRRRRGTLQKGIVQPTMGILAGKPLRSRDLSCCCSIAGAL